MPQTDLKVLQTRHLISPVRCITLATFSLNPSCLVALRVCRIIRRAGTIRRCGIEANERWSRAVWRGRARSSRSPAFLISRGEGAAHRTPANWLEPAAAQRRGFLRAHSFVCANERSFTKKRHEQEQDSGPVLKSVILFFMVQLSAVYWDVTGIAKRRLLFLLLVLFLFLFFKGYLFSCFFVLLQIGVSLHLVAIFNSPPLSLCLSLSRRSVSLSPPPVLILHSL